MKKIIPALAFIVFLGGCTAAMNQGKWDSWIGRNWHDYNATNGSKNCAASGNIVTCPLALGDLHFYIDGGGTIQSWDYTHRN